MIASSAELPFAPPSIPSPPGRSVVEVALPMRANQKWVSYACRTAGVGKPKWDTLREVWNSVHVATDGVTERIAITANGDSGVRVRVDWDVDAQTAHRHTSTARRIVSALIMAMQADVRRRTSGLLIAAPKILFPDDRS